MLELKNISKCYGQKEIFKDFNLTVEEGKILFSRTFWRWKNNTITYVSWIGKD